MSLSQKRRQAVLSSSGRRRVACRRGLDQRGSCLITPPKYPTIAVKVVTDDKARVHPAARTGARERPQQQIAYAHRFMIGRGS